MRIYYIRIIVHLKCLLGVVSYGIIELNRSKFTTTKNQQRSAVSSFQSIGPQIMLILSPYIVIFLSVYIKRLESKWIVLCVSRMAFIQIRSFRLFSYCSHSQNSKKSPWQFLNGFFLILVIYIEMHFEYWGFPA